MKFTRTSSDVNVVWNVASIHVRDGCEADDMPELNGYLEDGWEPFAVTSDGDGARYHVRRMTLG